jgi:hypothetical protein
MFECYAKTLAAATEYPTSVDKSRTVDKRGQNDRIHQMVARAKRVEVMPELVRELAQGLGLRSVRCWWRPGLGTSVWPWRGHLRLLGAIVGVEQPSGGDSRWCRA